MVVIMIKKQNVLDIINQMEWLYYEALNEQVDFQDLDEYEIVQMLYETVQDTKNNKPPTIKLRIVK